MQLSVEGDVKKVLKDMDKVRKKLVPSAASQALNATTRGVIKKSTKAIAGATGIAEPKIKYRARTKTDKKGKSRKAKRIHVRKKDKAKTRKLYTTITDYFHAGISAILLGAKDSKALKRGKNKGTGVRVRQGPVRHIGKAWIAKGKKSGKELVFHRRPYGNYPNPGRGGGTGPAEVRVPIIKVARRLVSQIVKHRGGKMFKAEFDTRLAKKLKAKGL
jgi:hypothetical protein